MRLKATGMPIAGMQAFAALRAEGQQTFCARRDLLVAHRNAVLARIADLQANLGAIVDKIAYYEGEAAGQTSAAESQARRIDDTSSFSHSGKEKDSPWTTRKTSVTRKAGTN